ncbi:MAG TPA: hypothetical protein VKB93_13020 [Thermoanaerobaculia bacterium]|nr:hypothetical protein [Thermoanaerobaculia bacterium]
MRAVLIAALLAAALWSSGRDYAQLVRDSWAMFRLPYEERRERVLGGDYAAMRTFAEELPRDARVAIVLHRPSDIDRGIFLNYYLYPRPTTINVERRALARRIETGGLKPAAPLVIVVDGSDMYIEP